MVSECNLVSASFRELGPPDLCHVVKSSGRQVAREVDSQYRTKLFNFTLLFSFSVWLLSLRFWSWRLVFCLFGGLYQLSYICDRRCVGVVQQSPAVQSQKWVLLVSWFRLEFNQKSKFTHLVGSCFNAFSRVDIRVDVKIPGGVNAYVIDLRGERCA